MAENDINYDYFTLLHLVAAQLTAGAIPDGSSAQATVEKYQQIYNRLKQDGGLSPEQ